MNHRSIGLEFEYVAVDAVALVSRRRAVVEDVAQVAAAVGADDLGPAAIGVGDAPDAALDLVVEARPAAAAVELVLRAVERGVALPADVGARRITSYNVCYTKLLR